MIMMAGIENPKKRITAPAPSFPKKLIALPCSEKVMGSIIYDSRVLLFLTTFSRAAQ